MTSSVIATLYSMLRHGMIVYSWSLVAPHWLDAWLTSNWNSCIWTLMVQDKRLEILSSRPTNIKQKNEKNNSYGIIWHLQNQSPELKFHLPQTSERLVAIPPSRSLPTALLQHRHLNSRAFRGHPHAWPTNACCRGPTKCCPNPRDQQLRVHCGSKHLGNLLT